MGYSESCFCSSICPTFLIKHKGKRNVLCRPGKSKPPGTYVCVYVFVCAGWTSKATCPWEGFGLGTGDQSISNVVWRGHSDMTVSLSVLKRRLAFLCTQIWGILHTWEHVPLSGEDLIPQKNWDDQIYSLHCFFMQSVIEIFIIPTTLEALKTSCFRRKMFFQVESFPLGEGMACVCLPGHCMHFVQTKTKTTLSKRAKNAC